MDRQERIELLAIAAQVANALSPIEESLNGKRRVSVKVVKKSIADVNYHLNRLRQRLTEVVDDIEARL